MIALELFNKKAYCICNVPKEALPIVLKHDSSFMDGVIEVAGKYTNNSDYDAQVLQKELREAGFEAQIFNIEDS